MTFDPYYQWLGIPPEKQPPDCYQLLGIRRFEQNPTVISHAAERQLLMLKTMQNGPHGALTQKLMNEVTAARICLLDPQKRAQYDAAIRKQAKVSKTPPPPRPPEPTLSSSSEPPPTDEHRSAMATALPEVTTVRPRVRHRSSSRPSGFRKSRFAMRVVAGTVTVIGIVAALYFANGRGAGLTRVADVDRSQEQTDRPPGGATRALVPSPSGEASDEPANDVPDAASAQPAETKHVDADGGSASDEALLEDNAPERSTTDEGGLDEPAHIPEPKATPVDESLAFSRLPDQVNVLETVDATGAGYVYVGELAAPAMPAWQISVKDYASPAGSPRFAIGVSSSNNDLLTWPITHLRLGESAAGQPGAKKKLPGSQVLAWVDANSKELSLRLANPNHQQLARELSLCGLVVENGHSRHHVQLCVPRRISPVLLAFDKARQTIALDAVPEIDAIPPERLLLEILRVDQSQHGTPIDMELRAATDEEVTVTLDEPLQCQLSVKLMQSAQQYGISVMPRYVQNDRKQPLIPAAITKEIARAKAQLIRNQRDLSEAQNSLRALPQEINRVRAIVPRSPAAATAKQAQLSRLLGIADNMQSRVRRLSKVIPDQAATIDRMERVLAYSNQLSDHVTLHFRIYLQDASGDSLLLLVASAAEPAAP